MDTDILIGAIFCIIFLFVMGGLLTILIAGGLQKEFDKKHDNGKIGVGFIIIAAIIVITMLCCLAE